METAVVISTPQFRPWTYDDLLALPDDGKRYEIVDGELVEMTGASFLHQHIQSMLIQLIGFFLRSRDIGVVVGPPLDVRLTPSFVFQPDLVIILRGNPSWPHLNNLGRLDTAPDVAIEILSPSTRGYDIIRKSTLYASFGVREYWIVDPESGSVDVQLLREGAYVSIPQNKESIRSVIIDGLVIAREDVFSIPQ